MHHDHDAAQCQTEALRCNGIVNGGDFLHLQVVVAAAQRAHFFALSAPCVGRDKFGFGVQHLAVLFNAQQISR